MPRKAKALPQNVGNPQTSYPDAPTKAGPAEQPVRAPTGMPYGANQQLRQSQQAVPLPQGAEPPKPNMASVLGDAAALRFPDSRLGDPSSFPREPVTAGLPVGAGPGPEVMGQRPNAAATVLRILADSTGDADLRELARAAESLG